MTLFKILNIVLSVYMWIVIIRAVTSWLKLLPSNPIVYISYKITEPILAPIRRTLPVVAGGMDFSPVIVVVVIILVKTLLFRALM